jgi:hypothetical protein
VAFTPDQLLLTAARQAQLTTALANTTEDAPLETLIAEAEARVDLDLGDATVDDALRNTLVRAFTLHAAYSLVGPIPKDVATLYTEAKALLERAITGSDPAETDDPRAGAYGGETKIPTRS